MPALPDYCYGNAAYVAAHCRGVIILISRSTYSPVGIFIQPIFPLATVSKKGRKPHGHKKGKPLRTSLFYLSGAGEESRTLDLNLGKVALYQLSYSRVMARLPRLHFICGIVRGPNYKGFSKPV